MQERPEIADAALVGHVREGWGLKVAELRFMPVGYDASAWSYDVRVDTGERYFLKVRRGETALGGVTVARHLRDRGLRQVVAVVDAVGGDGWFCGDGHLLLLYPFVDGQDTGGQRFGDDQWAEYGEFLGALHGIDLPADVAAVVADESYQCPEAEGVRRLADHTRRHRYGDQWQRALVDSWRTHEDLIAALADRVDQLGELARAQGLPHVLCHADLHAGNILVDGRGGLFVVDWDAPVRAPAERDLQFVVGATFGGSTVTDGQMRSFWRGYGDAEVNWPALAYYRYQRVVEDIDAFAREVLFRNDLGAETKASSLGWFRHQFEPGNAVDLAVGTERRVVNGLVGSVYMRTPERGVHGVPQGYALRRADEGDVNAVTELVDAAYGHYVMRIGRQPGPMTDDYRRVIADSAVTVAVTDDAVAGLIVLSVTAEGFLVENVAVHPSHQGRGLGSALLDFAEGAARRAGFDSIYLYTHEKMTENLALYRRLGYVEYDRRSEAGFSRVFLRKKLSPP